MSEAKFQMSINLQVLNHLGLNLYSNTSAVLSEVVANAWDADATDVKIKIDGDTISIADNGIGMNLLDINNKYLTVGYQKRSESGKSPIFHRPVMGRKGIGKLSLFSIANIVEVYSKKDEEINGFKIDTNSLREAIKSNDTYYPVELPTDGISFTGNGTKIILSDLKKKRTAALATHLRQRLARRFGIIGAKNNFNVSINDEDIVVSDRNYLSKAQCVWMFLPEKNSDEFKEDIKSQTKSEKIKLIKELPSAITIGEVSYRITGWIATCSEPKELDDDENLNRIVIMVRGKMAKEDIFSEIGTTALYSKYVYGELSADFLDLDDEADITTSSRQDFFEDDERYIALKEFIKKALSSVRNDWEETRSTSGVDEACKYVVVSDWYNELKGDDKKSAKKLFGKINQLTVERDEKKELFKHGVLAFESFKLKNELSQLEKISAENIAAFIEVAGRLDNIEATMYYQIVQERLAVIQKMQDVVSDGSLEKVIQDHLSKNLWLLDPSWDRSTELPIVEQAFKTQFDTINAGLSKEELDARLDIRYKKASNKHLIIELKKGDRTVKSQEITAQVYKYFSATKKVMATLDQPEPFEIIVLLGRHLDGEKYDEEVYQATKNALKAYHCRIMYYDELLKNAQNLYSDFLEQNKNLSTLSDIINELELD
ncbi:ATP-binding protein [[Clostridium] scindens]|uniref:BbrUII/HgiDII family restriction enzyme n=1 Tax=Clostridium scindens (strain JCM 10418 / VPI 12708) TaxID=29347 RepID=UPI003AEF9775